MMEHVLRFSVIDEVKVIVILGEVGGLDEYEVAKVIKVNCHA